jgi:hypothetical protein
MQIFRRPILIVHDKAMGVMNLLTERLDTPTFWGSTNAPTVQNAINASNNRKNSRVWIIFQATAVVLDFWQNRVDFDL